MANLILCPCLHFYMELPCMHHMGHIASLSIKTFYLSYLCCLHPNITKMFYSSDTLHWWNKSLVLSFEQTKCISPHLTVAHVCVWSWKLLIVCFSFHLLAVKACIPHVVVLFLPFILNKTSLTWLIFLNMKCLLFIQCCWVNNVLSCFVCFFVCF